MRKLINTHTPDQRFSYQVSLSTRSQSRQYQMSADTADALLVHSQRTVEEGTAIERLHDLLEEEYEWLG